MSCPRAFIFPLQLARPVRGFLFSFSPTNLLVTFFPKNFEAKRMTGQRVSPVIPSQRLSDAPGHAAYLGVSDHPAGREAASIGFFLLFFCSKFFFILHFFSPSFFFLFSKLSCFSL